MDYIHQYVCQGNLLPQLVDLPNTIAMQKYGINQCFALTLYNIIGTTYTQCASINHQPA